MRVGIATNVRCLVAALVVMAVMAIGDQANGATPHVRAQPLVSSPAGTYLAQLAPIIGGSGSVSLTYSGSSWHGTAHMSDVEAGTSYTVVIVMPTSYDSGEFDPTDDTYSAYNLCMVTPRRRSASCHASGLSLGGASALPAQSFAEMILTQIDRPVAQGAFDYTSTLAASVGQSPSGSAWLKFEDSEWSGQVRLRGLQPHTTYSWAVTVVTSYNAEGDPQGFHTISVCTFATNRAHSGHCDATGIAIGRDDLPPDSTTQLLVTNTTVAEGPLT